MNTRTALIVWIVTLAVSWLIDQIWGPFHDFLVQLTPVSIWALPTSALPAIAATLAASILAWLAALLVGGLVGLFVAAGTLAKRETGHFWTIWSKAASGMRRAYTWLYVVPLVLTISASTTALLKLQNDDVVGEPTAAIVLIVVSGIALAGQRIFVAIDDAVSNATTDELLLARSLYLGEERRISWISRMIRLWREARFLLACRITLLAQAVEQAFHLAVVGVVILETVSGLYIYQMMYPQEFNVLPWGGGIGRIIINAQHGTNPTTVAGAVWLILLIDSLLAWAIRGVANRWWIKPYNRTQ
jgi:hypothetical protein